MLNYSKNICWKPPNSRACLLSGRWLRKWTYSSPLCELHSLYRTCLNVSHQSNRNWTTTVTNQKLSGPCHVVWYPVPRTHKVILLVQKWLQIAPAEHLTETRRSLMNCTGWPPSPTLTLPRASCLCSVLQHWHRRYLEGKGRNLQGHKFSPRMFSRCLSTSMKKY